MPVFLRLLLTLLLFVPAMPIFAEGTVAGIHETGEYLIYVPAGLTEGEKYPLIVGFSPSADARGLIKTWKAQADKCHCIIMASRIIKNGMDIPMYLKRFSKLIHEKVATTYPVRLDQVIALGSSGGGMASHLFAFFHPDTVSAVISNVGYIHENSLKHKDTYPKNKVCAFLTSPTDFNYKLMKEDEKFLATLGWKLKWYEFAGGHVTAPDNIREEALTWVLQTLNGE
jgi:hypothetical protein